MSEGPNVAPVYISYLLRLWSLPREEGAPAWRASLEAPLSRERYNFVGLESLFAFLQAETEQASLSEPASDGINQC